MNHHTLAIICIVGSCLDFLGGLYLAYDLLGGEHGPLRAVSRGVTYGVMYAVGWGIPLGPAFGIACGITHGFTLAWEFSLASRGVTDPGFRYDAAASTIRSIGHGVGISWYFGPSFGVAFGAVSAISQIAAYHMGIRPTMDYSPAPHIRIGRRQVLAALNRTVGYGLAAALLCAFVAHRPSQAVSFGLRIGLSIGLVTGIGSCVTPVIEWAADHVAERRMGIFGVALIMAGFGLQSLQYWIALLDIPLR